MEVVEVYTSLLHGEGWVALTNDDERKVLRQLINGDINIKDLKIKELK